jgi:guanylate kinase
VSDNDAKTTDDVKIAPPRQGRLFVVSGPSGVGKDALLGRLYKCLPGIQQSVSATTRAPRPGEVDSVDYYFITHVEFEADIVQGSFLEYARYGPDFYGTPRRKVDALCDQGVDVVLKIEVQGAEQIKALVPDATLIFIKPPHMAELERRLRMRGTDTEARIQERLAVAQYEMAHIFRYEYALVNDDFDTALNVLCAIVTAERERPRL